MSVTDAPGAERTARIDEWMARGDDEDVRWSGHPRVTTALPSVVVGVALAAVGVALVVGVGGAARQTRPLVALLVPAGIAVAVGAYLRVVNVRYVVTDRALYRKTGVLSRRVERVSLSRVQNSSFTQGMLGSLFDYGTVSVEAAGGGAIAFADVDDPRAVRTLIERQIGDDDVPGDAEQWTAVLGEVRRLRSAVERRGR